MAAGSKGEGSAAAGSEREGWVAGEGWAAGGGWAAGEGLAARVEVGAGGLEGSGVEGWEGAGAVAAP